MKKNPFIRLLAGISLLLFSLLVFSCSRDDNPAPAGTGQPVSKPVGQPAGELYTEFIGPEGGLVKSPDGIVEILFPQGALTEETEVGIEPLNNTSPGGFGAAYRLTPHGKTFKKPVTVRFHYARYKPAMSSAQALEIAYQNDKGVWTCPGKTTNDTARKIISIQTDHFSDWSFIASLELSPVVKTVGLGEQVKLKTIRYVYPVKDDFIVPLATPSGTGDPVRLESEYIVKWTLNGPGKLDVQDGEATYTAPSARPAQKTATVTVELNVKGVKVLLISTIHLIEEGISISIDGGPWQTYSGAAGRVPDDGQFYYTISSLRVAVDIPQISFHWYRPNGVTATGVFPWRMEGDISSSVVFQYAEPDLKHIYSAVYEQDNDRYDSGGFLSVEETSSNGKKYVEGVFVVDKAGYIEAFGEIRQIKVSSITGTFKVQRGW